MRLLKTSSLKASSISESVVAMALIAICLAMTMAIYSQVINSSQNVSDAVAEQKVKELVIATEEEQSFSDEDFDFDVFHIEKRVSKIEALPLQEVQFTIINNNKKQTSTYLINEK